MATLARFHLGKRPDVGWLAGIPGVRPLELHDDVLVAAVEDPAEALRRLKEAGFGDATLVPDADDPGPRAF